MSVLDDTLQAAPVAPPTGDLFAPDAIHDRLRAHARSHGTALLQRHEEDAVGRPLGYAAYAASVAATRLERLGAERAIRLERARAAAGAAGVREVAARRALGAAIASAKTAGVADPEGPIGGRFMGLGFAIGGVVTLVAAIVTTWVADSPQVGAVVAGAGVVGAGACLAWIAPSLLPRLRCKKAADELMQAEVEQAETEGRVLEITDQTARLAHAEVALARELREIHLDAARLAAAPGVLADGAVLTDDEITLQVPAWATS